jgi:ADP-ribose pyrophosphatase YjhB (NUDIX family)
MPLNPKFCSQCGALVQRRSIGDRERDVCSRCQTVFYQNPLPVAAAVVVNEKREVLLVRRKSDPQRGMWCLPIGFAELNETIEQAAVRELREEAGITGRVLRLLEVDSYQSDFYGDLLIVSFEVEYLSGAPAAGDDAEEVAFHPLANTPPLAFAANEQALRAYLAIHHEDWQIADSFSRLQDQGDRVLLSDALLQILNEHALEVAGLWLSDVCRNPTTPSYRNVPPETLLEKARLTLSKLSGWLKDESTGLEIKEFYQTLGRERRSQGFSLAEVISALTLLRKHIWLFVNGQGVWERPIDVYRVLELEQRVIAFFDKAMFHTVLGFELTKR